MGYAATAIGLFIFILAYFTFNAPIPDQEQKVKVEPKTTFCEKSDPASAPTFQAPADNAMKVGTDDINPDDGTVVRGDCGSYRHQLSNNKVTYRLIRKNVPLSKTDVKEH